MCAGSCDKIINEHLDYASISTPTNKSMNKDSSFGDNLEDVADSDLEIDNLMREPCPVIEECLVSAYYVEY